MSSVCIPFTVKRPSGFNESRCRMHGELVSPKKKISARSVHLTTSIISFYFFTKSSDNLNGAEPSVRRRRTRKKTWHISDSSSSRATCRRNPTRGRSIAVRLPIAETSLVAAISDLRAGGHSVRRFKINEHRGTPSGTKRGQNAISLVGRLVCCNAGR